MKLLLSRSSRHLQELDDSLRLSGPLCGPLPPAVRLALLQTGQDGDGHAGSAPAAELPRFREAAPFAGDHPALRLGALERRMFGHLDAQPQGPQGGAPSATSRKRRRLRQAVDQTKVDIAVPSTGLGLGRSRGTDFIDHDRDALTSFVVWRCSFLSKTAN